MRILIVGGTGLVGSNIAATAKEEHDVIVTSRNPKVGECELNKANFNEALSLIQDENPDAVIDTAAFHAVDDCETQRQKAFNVNAVGTRNVATAADDTDAHYVYLSTDYVFPGYPEETPYSEDNRVNPLNYYAETKYAGEQAAKIAEEYAILRPSVIYGLASDNFVTWALDELEAGNELTIVDDQVSAPTYAPDLARACVNIVEGGYTGLYHAVGPESCSRYEFTVKLAEVYGYDTDLVKPISTEEFGQKAPRPEDSTLDSTKLYETLEFEFRAPGEGFTDMKKRE